MSVAPFPGPAPFATVVVRGGRAMTHVEPKIVVDLGLDLNLIKVVCPCVCDVCDRTWSEIETIPLDAIVLGPDDTEVALDAPTDAPTRRPGVVVTWPLEQTRCEDCVRMMGEPEDGDDDEEDAE